MESRGNNGCCCCTRYRSSIRCLLRQGLGLEGPALPYFISTRPTPHPFRDLTKNPQFSPVLSAFSWHASYQDSHLRPSYISSPISSELAAGFGPAARQGLGLGLGAKSAMAVLGSRGLGSRVQAQVLTGGDGIDTTPDRERTRPMGQSFM
ncbi:hypothetical protein B0H11DRAFT_155274 [Mycena galericulata]|nr:hypothetical protein B0H11DRAFT_155274 [Mycena galericulata]